MRKFMVTLFLSAFSLFAFCESGPGYPLYTWGFTDFQTLNGHFFGTLSAQDAWDYSLTLSYSYKEQTGYCIINGNKNLCYLYDTYTYHDGHGQFLIDQAIPRWIEEKGYVIDYDNMEHYNCTPFTSLQKLMQTRNCDVAVRLLNGNPKKVEIVNYDAAKNYYWCVVYPYY